MIDYSNKICEACSVDAPKATQSEIEDFLKNHNDWYLATDVEFPQLRREFKFNVFSTAQKFTNIISDLIKKKIKELDLDINHLISLPDSISNLTSLTELSLNGNSFSDETKIRELVPDVSIYF